MDQVIKKCLNCNKEYTGNKISCSRSCSNVLRTGYKFDGTKEEWLTFNKQKRKEYRELWRKNNPDKVKAYSKTTAQRDPDRKRNLQLKYNFGITLEEYETLLQKQNGLCLICKQPETLPAKAGKIRNLAVDHCHKTNKIRGLLCGACNKGIGLLKDDPELLIKATEYLKSYEALENII